MLYEVITHRQILNHCLRINRQAELPGKVKNEFLLLVQTQRGPVLEFGAQDNILGDGEAVHLQELLVNHADATVNIV